MSAFEFDKTKPIDVICMGRVGVDLYAEQISVPLSEVSSFKKYLGGSPGNISVGTSRLDLKSALFSCVGRDDMGLFLRKTLKKEGVNTSLLYESDKHLTALVLLGIEPPDRFPLIFYRNDCADMQLKPEHTDNPLLTQTKLFQFSGTGISTESMRQVTKQAIETSTTHGSKIVLDVDFRPVLWGLTEKGNGETRFRANLEVSKHYQDFLPYCDLIVGTDEELMIASGKQTAEEAIEEIQKHSNAIIVYKQGMSGSSVHFPKSPDIIHQATYPVDVLNTLGAGDAFLSGLLYALINQKTWQEALSAANAAGAIVSSRHGCAPAMPRREELELFLKEYPIKGKEVMKQMNEPKSEKKQPLIKQEDHFPYGQTNIVEMNDAYQTGMNFSVIKLKQGESKNLTSPLESALLLMTGEVSFEYGDKQATVKRYSYFNETPYVLHTPKDMSLSITAITDCECLLMQTENDQIFEATLFDETNMLENEHRGQGLLDDASYRIVRTVFDKRNRPESNLVVGEIITFQGNWSSYPPHHHPQPEVYHYRFSEPQGFAFAEDGKDALKVHHNDTLVITDEKSHAHAAAPGYALYTLWFIRHLEDNPYIVPNFEKKHDWTRDKSANARAWRIDS